jgi:methionine-rich copper-binding protein CopC
LKTRAVFFAAALAWIPLPAMAHAFLEKASPSAGENLNGGPAKVDLRFSEALEPSFSSATVTDRNGHDMAAGPVIVNGTEMAVPLKKLTPGRYRVSWHAISVDTHRSEGRYNFLVQQ